MRRYIEALKENLLRIIFWAICSGIGYIIWCIIFSYSITENIKYIFDTVIVGFLVLALIVPILDIVLEYDD